MRRITTVAAATALAVSAMTPAFAGNIENPIVEGEVFEAIEPPTSSAGSLGSTGALPLILLGVIAVGAAVSSSSGT